MFSLYPILPRRGPSPSRPSAPPWHGPPVPSTPRPPMPARRGDRALSAAGLLAVTGAALLAGTYLFGALPTAAVAIGAVLTRWALAARRRSAVQRPKG